MSAAEHRADPRVVTRLTAVAVDDERIARRRIVRLLEETGEVDVVAECAAGRDAVAAVREHHPALLFLDVQMPDLDGFGVLGALAGEPLPAVVFVTAYDRYALKAFDVHALDYLLKPYDTARFRQAFARAKEYAAGRTRDEEEARVRGLLRDYLAEGASQARAPEYLDRVAVKVEGTLRPIKISDVDYWETAGNYVRAHVGGVSHLIRATIVNIEARLDPRQFLRIHRRYLVNVDRIVEVQPWFAGDGVVVLRTGAKLRLSRSYRASLHGRLTGGGTRSDDDEP